MSMQAKVDERALAELVSLWLDRRAEGRDDSPVELCRDRPELLAELQHRLTALERMNALVDVVRQPETIAYPKKQAASLHTASTLDAGPSAATSTIDTPQSWPHIPGYEILSELGSGGMGIVYQARQTALNRVVAVKMIRAERFSREELNRFLAEAESAAAVQDTRVVQVYEYGHNDGRPFLVLEYLPGGSLAERLRKEKRLAPRKAGILVAKLARAVHAVHERGIVHRDLKPGNVLFDEADEPKITDFGLAKRGTRSDLTGTNAVMGTAAYMAPEQAQGRTKFVGPAADIYALGVILYECLAGAPPFESEETLVLLRKVAEDEPVPPGKRTTGIPVDLDLICLKCMAKEPAERYATAADFAADLDHFLAGEPVGVRAMCFVERAAKWARRKPTLAAAYALSLLALTLTVVTAETGWLWRQAEIARRDSLEARDHLALEMQQTEQALRQTEAARLEVTHAKNQLDTALKGERLAKERESAARAKLDQLLYSRRVSLAYSKWRDNEIAYMEQLLTECPPKYRNWEWNYLHGLTRVHVKTLHGPTQAVLAAAVSSDGSMFAGAYEDGTAQVWDAPSAKVLSALKGHTGEATCLAFSPDNRRLFSGGLDGQIIEWDARKGERLRILKENDQLRSPTKPHRFPSNDKRGWMERDFDSTFFVAWKPPHTKSIKGTGRSARPALPISPKGRFMVRTKSPANKVISLDCSADGRILAGAYADGVIRLWNAETGNRLFSFQSRPAIGNNHHSFSSNTYQIFCIAISPDGKYLAGAGANQLIRIWDTATGKAVASFDAHSDRVICVAFSPDGRLLASGGEDESVRVWDTAKKREISILRGHNGPVTSVAFRQDGKQLASGGADRVVRVWNLSTAKEIRTLRGHTEGINDVAFWPGGKRLLSASNDKTLKIWELQTRQDVLLFAGHGEQINGVAFSPDNSRLASASDDKTVILRDVRTGKVEYILRGHAAAVNDVIFSPDGRSVATGSEDKTVRIWDAISGEETHILKGHLQAVEGVAFSPDGARLASASEDGTVKLWNTATATLERTLNGHSDYVYAVAFSPDGQRLASASKDCSIILWDADTGRQLRTLKGHTCAAACVVFSPDGTQLASVGLDNTVRIWDATSGTQCFSLSGHTAAVLSVAFSPDGQRLASAGADRTVKLWDARTGEEVLSLRQHNKQVNSVAFSADGHCLATASSDRTVAVWRDAATAEQFSSPPPEIVGERLKIPPRAKIPQSEGKQLKLPVGEQP